MKTSSLLAAACVLLAPMLAGAANAAAAEGERYAFLVSVRAYDQTELTSLKYSENDIVGLAAALKRTGYPDKNVTVLGQTVGAEKVHLLPLCKNIKEQMLILLRALKAEDSVLVAFAGHGVQFKGEEGAYFCPMDAKLADRTTLIPIDGIYRALEQCPAKSKVLLVDACRNDPQSQLGRTAATVELEAVGRPPVAPPPGVVAFFSCSKSETAYEHPSLNHGVFFHYVIEGLAGKADVDRDQDVTFPELQLYAVKQVQTFVRTELGKLQTPEAVGKTSGLLKLSRVDPTLPPEPPLPIPMPNPMPVEVTNLKELMRQAHGDEGQLKLILAMVQEVRRGDATWENFERKVAEYAKLARRMPNYKPPRGAEFQYKALAQQYLLQVQALESAAKDHDTAAAERAIGRMNQSCTGCHQMHK